MRWNNWGIRLNLVHGVTLPDRCAGVPRPPSTVRKQLRPDPRQNIINGEKAGNARAVFNIDLGSDGGKYKLELENGVLNHTQLMLLKRRRWMPRLPEP